ncbi:uncharacterized methyltransferase-like C25B8.10 [Actinia tenebrosa]|uniref:Uncharacterized methyltransferase-like C25B8.10 n=1 Tax=Actinia tenebrosa TaxID=6105 RepID=A0A6P8HHS1_ACTTE|nr:uncharacterized methyltransferase-like C25B8.10 [Actinia tenebrosa]
MADDTKDGGFKVDIDLYEKGRPKYTKESVEYLLKQVGVLGKDNDSALTILELGAGTGMFTKVLVEALKGFPKIRIIASDPQLLMLEKLKKNIPGIEAMQFLAEKIPFPDESIDIVIAAQCFHWFANAQSVAEIHRVLVPRGTFGMIWNSRNQGVDWVVKTQKIIAPYLRRDNNPNNLDNTWMEPIKSSQLFGELQGNNDLCLDHEGSADNIINTIMCISSITKCTDEEKKDIKSKILDVLTNHPDLKGLTKFKLPYIVPIYWCTKR